MPADGRVGAWLSSWELLKTYSEYRHKLDGKSADLLLTHAQILSDLSNAPEDVGVAAGEYLQQIEAIREKGRAKTIEFLQEYTNKAEEIIGGTE